MPVSGGDFHIRFKRNGARQRVLGLVADFEIRVPDLNPAHFAQNFAGDHWWRVTLMSLYSILADGKLAIRASERSSKHDFDFLLGGWKIRNRKLKEPLAGCDEWVEFDATQNLRQILKGFGNFDIFSTEFDGKPFEGFTLRLFDPQTRLWTIYWADNSAVKLDGGKVGSFDGDIGEFFAREVFAGKSIIVKFYWDKRNPEAPVWSAAFSVDEGQTWEWNWHAYFARPSLCSCDDRVGLRRDQIERNFE